MSIKEKCPDCNYPKSMCLCQSISTTTSSKLFLVLQHPQESREPFNTARLLALSLPRSVTVATGLSWRNLGHAMGEVSSSDVSKKWALLYYKSGDKNQGEEKQLDLARYNGFILLDGTWSQVKSMVWRNRWLLKLPKIALFPENGTRYNVLRRAPSTFALSTLETAQEILTRVPENREATKVLTHNFSAFLDAAKRCSFSS